LTQGFERFHFIFTLLNPYCTKTFIIVDIPDFGGETGEIRRLSVDELPVEVIRTSIMGRLNRFSATG
jgi:Ni,Fe-hydrogenase maturation factor